jgi:hypothetical protein
MVLRTVIPEMERAIYLVIILIYSLAKRKRDWRVKWSSY